MTDTETPETAPPASETLSGKIRGLVEEHPVAMLAGGLLFGALVARSLARPSKGKAPSADTPAPKPQRSLARRAAHLAVLGAELAAAYAAGADSAAEAAENSAPPGPPATPEPAKPAAGGVSALAKTALRTLGPLLGSRFGRNSRS